MKGLNFIYVVKLTASVALLINLFACGGGGGGGSSSTAPGSICAGNIFEALEPNTSIAEKIASDTTLCFKFTAVENTTYKFSLQSLVGDVDIAAHDSNTLDSDSVIVYSINGSTLPDELVFTADATTEYYVELYAYERSEYVLDFREVDTADYLSIGAADLFLSGTSSHDLPANQQLIQPDIGTQPLVATLNLGLEELPEVRFISPTTAPDWLSLSSTGYTSSTVDYEYAVTRTDLPVGDYQTQVRLIHSYRTNIRVFQNLNLNYSLAARPFDLHPNNTHTATLNSSYSFDLSANSSQTLEYGVHHAPNGFSLDATGHASWLPSMPMFSESLDIQWGLTATLNDISILVQDTIQLSKPSFEKPIVRTGMTFAEFVYDGMMTSADWDNDGKTEIIITNTDKVLYSVEYDGADYREDWVSPYSLSNKEQISFLSTEDLDGDSVDELVIGMRQTDTYTLPVESTILVMDGESKQVLNSVVVDAEVVKSIYTGDIDNDGKIELVVLGTTDSTRVIRIYEGINLTLEWASPILKSTGGLPEIRLGNVDGDPAMEIVTGMGHVIDGLTHETQLIKADGFPGYPLSIAVGDADNDGIDDILHTDYDNIYIYDGSGTLKYQFNGSQLTQSYGYAGKFYNVTVGDLTGSGKNHIIVSSQNSIDEVGFYMFNETTASFEVDYRINHLSSAIQGFMLDDFDNDGTTELLWREGGNSTGKDGFVIASYQSAPDTVELEWYTHDPSEFNYYGFFTPHYVKNLSNENKIWFISNDSEELDTYENRGPRLLELDLLSSNLTVTSPIYYGAVPYYSASCTYRSVFMAIDLNLDTVHDAIIPPCKLNHPAISMDLQSGSSILFSGLGFSMSGVGEIEAMDVGDFGDNGSLEVAVVTQYGAVYVYDPHTNLLLWEHDFGNQGNGESIFIQDLDNDGLPELLVALDQKIVSYTYNDADSSFNQAGELEFTNLMDVKIADLNGDGLEEIVVMHGAYLDYTLSIYDNSLASIASNHISYLFTSMHIEDLPGDKKNILLSTLESSSPGFGSLEINRLRALDPYTGAVIWSSPNLLGAIPKDSLSYMDIDGDTAKEMYFTTDKSINVIY